jgi:hypothetical protein
MNNTEFKQVNSAMLQNLLNQINLIQKKYDDLAEYTGEKYNIFEILGVKNDELSHSAIIGNLLNINGKHGQKDIFLNLFLEEIKDKFIDESRNRIINNFDTENVILEIEKHVGKVNFDSNSGGRIDIILKDKNNNNIIIENKIYANDQYQQLLRYNEYDKKAPILYLTLNGKEPMPDSKGVLELGMEFICISYQTEIKNWLEKCIKEMVNKPFIRETLNQYLFTIDSLTNQIFSNKNKMEITKIIKENLKESHLIAKTFETAKKEIINTFWQNCFNKLKNELKEWEIENKPNYINSLNYILFHKSENNSAYFYCRCNINNGEIFFGITPNKEKFDKLNDDIKLNLIPEYKTGGQSIKWENYDKINLNNIDVLSEINDGNDGNDTIINELVEKMKSYIIANNVNYIKILNEMK